SCALQTLVAHDLYPSACLALASCPAVKRQWFGSQKYTKSITAATAIATRLPPRAYRPTSPEIVSRGRAIGNRSRAHSTMFPVTYQTNSRLKIHRFTRPPLRSRRTSLPTNHPRPCHAPSGTAGPCCTARATATATPGWFPAASSRLLPEGRRSHTTWSRHGQRTGPRTPAATPFPCPATSPAERSRSAPPDGPDSKTA